jgi:hypothetical protein
VKKSLVFILLLSVFHTFSQNDKTTFLENFDKTGMETSILYLIPTDLDAYKNESANMYNFYQIYKSIAQSDLDNRLPSLSKLKSRPKSDIISLTILHAEYDAITKEAKSNGSIVQNANGKITRTNNQPIFEKKEITISTPLIIKKKGLHQIYNLDLNDIYNTTENSIKSIQVNFDNGEGSKGVLPNQNILINYTSEGLKKLDFEITFNDGVIKKSSSTLKIEYSNSELNTLFGRVVNTFTSTTSVDLSAYGETTSYPGTGEYEIFLSADNILDKPIFVLDGFDPGDTRNIENVYSLLDFDNNGTTQNLADLVILENFDVIILNFPVYNNDGNFEVDGGADYIERNAMLLVDLIENINAQKIGNNQNVIVGPSVGGLISRYALNYMENESLDHDTRLWLSFDSPHLGANVPIGFQHLFNYLSYGLDTWAGDFSIEALRPIVDGMLKSSAARQMLTDQFESHLASGEIAEFDSSLTLPIAHPFKSIFYTDLNSLTTSGYPENLRKTSMINGSGEGSPYQHQDGSDVLPGDKVLDAFIPNVSTLTDAYFEVWLTPYANQEIKVDDIWIDAPWICFCDIYADANSKAFPYSNGIDAGSGGLFDLIAMADELGGSDPTIDAFFEALNVDYFNFIPTISAMALEVTNDEIDWFHIPSDLVSGVINNTTPFDAWYMPPTNETHTKITQGNFNFAWDEIVLGFLNTQEFDLNNSYTLVKNPVSDVIQIRTNKQDVEDISAKIFSITGQEVYSKIFSNPSNQIEISVNLSSGLYLLELNDSETIFKTKILIN